MNNPNMFPMQPMAQQMAQQGRYGDSMMVHMNPIEVAGIASLSPTGQLTTNPMTGQPEAFLPFLAPLLGSMFGSTITGALASGAGALGLGTVGAGAAAGTGLAGTLAGLSAPAASAIGSGLATTAVTGDIKEGLISGLTGFGLGKAFEAGAKSLQGLEGFEKAATEADKLANVSKAQEIAKGASPDALTAANNPFVAQAETARLGADAVAQQAAEMTPLEVIKEGGLGASAKGLFESNGSSTYRYRRRSTCCDGCSRRT